MGLATQPTMNKSASHLNGSPPSFPRLWSRFFQDESFFQFLIFRRERHFRWSQSSGHFVFDPELVRLPECTVILFLREYYGDREHLLLTHPRRIGPLHSILEHLDRPRESRAVFANSILGKILVTY